MKQSDKVYEMNRQRSICAFQEYHRFEQEQNQKDTIEEHIERDNKSHSFKHLHSTATCFDSYNSLCFKLIDKANSKFGLKIKEALHIDWRKPNLNAQQNHLALTLSLQLLFPLLLSVFVYFSFVVFCNSLSSIVFIICTLIIGTYHRLNYTMLLPHLFVTPLVIGFIITVKLTYVLGNYYDLQKYYQVSTNQLT